MNKIKNVNKEKDLETNFEIKGKYRIQEKVGQGGYGNIYIVKGIKDKKIMH